MKITNLEINEYNVKSAPDSLKAGGNVTPRDIKNIFDRLPELIVQKFNAFVDYVTSDFYTKEQTEKAISNRVTAIASADMQRSVYDSDNDGVVDNAKKLDGYRAEYFAKAEDMATKADENHTQSADTITAGVFSGEVMAYSENRASGGLRNIEIRATDTSGELQSTNRIIMVRK